MPKDWWGKNISFEQMPNKLVVTVLDNSVGMDEK
jgi:hypothetical protein